MKKKYLSTFVIIIPSLIVMFNIYLIMNPADMTAAAKEGLLLWFNQVLPSLLPFVVGANLLAGLGFIHFLGALAAPIMVPLFKVPGAGSYALLTGFTAGYPMGAKAVAHLRETEKIQQQEAQRLIAFSNNAGPLFIVGFIGTSLFGNTTSGYILLISHITAAMAMGLILRFFSKHPSEAVTSKKSTESCFILAFREFSSFRKDHYKGFGQALGTSIKNAMESMVLIGGYIIVFCVLIKALEISGMFESLSKFTDVPWITGFVSGFLEVANGARMISQGSPPNPAALSATAAVISFGGLSVHGQTAHFIRNTDIKMTPYLAAKCLQAVMAGAICLFITSYVTVPASAIGIRTLEREFLNQLASASYDFVILMLVIILIVSFISLLIKQLDF